LLTSICRAIIARMTQEITIAEMRSAGVRGVIVWCHDHRCSHSVQLDVHRWPDDVRLSDIEAASPAPRAANARRTCRPVSIGIGCRLAKWAAMSFGGRNRSVQ
jgi:hypothetical protein